MMGSGVKVDYKKAKEYFEKSGTASALNNLGYMYRNGLGVEVDYEKANEYFETSGNATALNNLRNLIANQHNQQNITDPV